MTVSTRNIPLVIDFFLTRRVISKINSYRNNNTDKNCNNKQKRISMCI